MIYYNGDEFCRQDTRYDKDGCHVDSVHVTNEEALKDLRATCKMSQKDFAQKFNIPFTTYTQWESGRRTPPTYVILMILKIVEDEMYVKASTTNAFMLPIKCIPALTKLDCPIRTWQSGGVVSSTDEFGERHYYLTIAEFDPAELDQMVEWLNKSYDEDLEKTIVSEVKKTYKTDNPEEHHYEGYLIRKWIDKFGPLKKHHLPQHRLLR